MAAGVQRVTAGVRQAAAGARSVMAGVRQAVVVFGRKISWSTLKSLYTEFISCVWDSSVGAAFTICNIQIEMLFDDGCRCRPTSLLFAQRSLSGFALLSRA